MWSTMFLSVALLLVAMGTLQAYPNDYNGQFIARQLEDFENLPPDQYLRPVRGFDTLKIGNTFGVAKRLQFKRQQNRRGTYNSIMGFGFGRTSRRDNTIKEVPMLRNREFGQLEAAPERRNNLDPFRFGAFGVAKRHNSDQDGGQASAALENPIVEDITQDPDNHKQDTYTPDNYMKLFQNDPNNNIEN